jgi:hypothetical protein
MLEKIMVLWFNNVIKKNYFLDGVWYLKRKLYLFLIAILGKFKNYSKTFKNKYIAVWESFFG